MVCVPFYAHSQLFPIKNKFQNHFESFHQQLQWTVLPRKITRFRIQKSSSKKELRLLFLFKVFIVTRKFILILKSLILIASQKRKLLKDIILRFAIWGMPEGLHRFEVCHLSRYLGIFCKNFFLNCRFAVVEMKIALAKILQSYSFDLDRSKTSVPMKIAPERMLIMTPAEGICINFHNLWKFEINVLVCMYFDRSLTHAVTASHTIANKTHEPTWETKHMNRLLMPKSTCVDLGTNQ